VSLNSDEIGRILDALDRSSWDQAEIVVGDVRIAVGRNDMPAPAPAEVRTTATPQNAAASAPAPADVPAVPPQAPDTPAPGNHVISAPSVGVFWRAPSPGAPPFVEVGATVAEGDTVCIVEVMKLMNNVVADVSGTVTAVFPANAEHVEFGAPLVAIRTDG
jgi:acetyl-CoA carboxylase biotin carboxyl carrier protein